MSALGAAALGGAALLLLRCYLAYLRARRDECLGFLSLLRELERGMSLFMESPASVLERVREEALERSGFMKALGEGATLAEAFAAAEGALLLPREVKRILADYFSRVGEGYLEGELRVLRRAIAELEPIAASELQEVEKRGRVAGVLTFSAVAGVIILLL